jgi:hypothetical protein
MLLGKLTFTDVGTAGGNIHVSFSTEGSLDIDEDKPGPNDGTGEFPPPGSAGQATQSMSLKLSGKTKWDRAQLFTLLVHEIGHTLGLTHSSDEKSTMSHFIPPLTPGKAVDAESADALDLLYGW